MSCVLSHLFPFPYFKGDAVFQRSELRWAFIGQMFLMEPDPVRPAGWALLEMSVLLISKFQP